MIPNYASLFAPLEKLRKEKVITWNQDFQNIYSTTLQILTSDLVLSFPNFKEEFIIATDASDHGLGAVLFQFIDGKRRYVKFAARSLSGAEATSYGATKRELLGIVFALKQFREYVWGTHFTIQCDHKALSFLHTQKIPNQMIQNWYEILMDYDFDIVHIPGISNVLPDK